MMAYWDEMPDLMGQEREAAQTFPAVSQEVSEEKQQQIQQQQPVLRFQHRPVRSPLDLRVFRGTHTSNHHFSSALRLRSPLSLSLTTYTSLSPSLLQLRPHLPPAPLWCQQQSQSGSQSLSVRCHET